MAAEIDDLLGRLAKAHFTGRLIFDFYRGEIVGAELQHNLGKNEFQNPLPIVEEQTEAKK